MELAADTPSSKKSFLATLRGSGGGKTRALEELRYQLLGQPGVLPLAITYNSAMVLYPRAEFGWSNNYELNYGMTVVARLATVFYGKPLDEMLDLLLERKWAGGVKYPLELIRGFLLHAVRKLEGIHTIVVLADEVARAEEAFASEYKLGEQSRDVTSLLRKAVLDAEIRDGLQATLVMSSLTLTPPDTQNRTDECVLIKRYLFSNSKKFEVKFHRNFFTLLRCWVHLCLTDAPTSWSLRSASMRRRSPNLGGKRTRSSSSWRRPLRTSHASQSLPTPSCQRT